MRHPSEGLLRRLVDDPAGVPDAEREHVVDCPRCLAELTTARDEALRVGAALSAEEPPDADLDAAWRRLSTAVPASAPTPTLRTGRATRQPRGRSVLRRPVIAALAVVFALSGAGVAAANDWLQIFRTEQITPVDLTTADLVALPDLSAYGDVDVTGDRGLHEVADAAAAEASTGLDAPQVTSMPRGVSGDPVYQVGGEVQATFTFSSSRAAQEAADAGETLPPPPSGLDGSRMRLDAGPGLAAVWTQDSGVPVLVVGRAVAPTAYSSGVPFETARDYLLSLPGLPEDLAAQLRTLSEDGSTLPLPVPADLVTTSATQVDGAPATLLVTNDRTMAAVVWVDDGVVTLVAGALDDDEVLSVARELR